MTARKESERTEVLLNEQYSAEDIPEEGKILLKEYSGIPEQELLPHIIAVRDKAFKTSPFPCVGYVRFLSDRWKSAPYKGEVLSRLRSGGIFFDIGCGLGQEPRHLSFTYGIDSSQLYATDLDPNLIQCGFDLFRDQGRIKSTLFASDILAPEASTELSNLKGKIDVINLSQFLHVWDWDEMVMAAKNIVGLSKGPGSLIVGTSLGSANAGSYEMPKETVLTGRHYRHSEGSWKRFWQQLSTETNTVWEASYQAFPSKAVEDSRSAWWAQNDPGMALFWFTVKRL